MVTPDDPRQGLCPPWCLIESSPANFAAMADMYGVKGVEFKEVYDFDNLLQSPTPVYGFIMSHAIDPEAPTENNSETLDPDAASLFFSCQVVANVCATSALLGVLLNTVDKDLVISEELKHFKQFTKDFSPVDRGMAIANCELLERTHNTFANFETKRDAAYYPRFEDFKPNKRQRHSNDDDPDYHFVAFVPANGYIWELDGFNKMPTKIRAISGNWIEQMVPYLKERMARSGNIDFSLLSISKATPHTSKALEHPLPTTSMPYNSASLARQQLDEIERLDSKINFYRGLIVKLDGYLDAKFYNWRHTPLSQPDEKCDMIKQCDDFVTGRSDRAQFDLIDATSRRGELTSQVNLRDQALSQLHKLVTERQQLGYYTQPKEGNAEANIGEEKVTIGPKELLRRRHNYELLIKTIFTKLQEENLILYP